MRFKIGDEILVTSGKDKGKRGNIERVYQGESKVLVAGANLFKKMVRQTSDRTNTGGLVLIARPLPVGNIAVWCKKCDKPTRVGYRMEKDKKIRFCRKCKEAL
jgi:large subunit ribosomal protein L24